MTRIIAARNMFWALLWTEDESRLRAGRQLQLAGAPSAAVRLHSGCRSTRRRDGKTTTEGEG